MKRVVTAVVAALVLSAGGVSAQAQATTTCSGSAGDMTCRTSADAPIDPKNVKPKPCGSFERLDQGAVYCDAREIAAKRKVALDLVADGKCAEAVKAAIGTGDLGFAKEVREFCTPPAAS